MNTKTIECPVCGQTYTLQVGTKETDYRCSKCDAKFTVSLIEDEQIDLAITAPTATQCLASEPTSELTPQQTFSCRKRKIQDIMNLIPPGKLKAIYLLWLFLNLMLFVLSPTPFGPTNRDSNARDYGSFYPFIAKSDYYVSIDDYHRGKRSSPFFFAHIEQYDITEFVFYSLAPLVFLQVVRLWRAPAAIIETQYAMNPSAMKPELLTKALLAVVALCIILISIMLFRILGSRQDAPEKNPKPAVRRSGNSDTLFNRYESNDY